MPYKIKARVYALNRKISELIPILRNEYGINVSPSELSTSISGNLQSPKAQDIVNYSNEIITKWEKECK